MHLMLNSKMYYQHDSSHFLSTDPLSSPLKVKLLNKDEPIRNFLKSNYLLPILENCSSSPFNSFKINATDWTLLFSKYNLLQTNISVIEKRKNIITQTIVTISMEISQEGLKKLKFLVYILPHIVSRSISLSFEKFFNMLWKQKCSNMNIIIVIKTLISQF